MEDVIDTAVPVERWMAGVWIDALPRRRELDPVAWGEQNVRLPGSARSERYDSSVTPWTREPLRSACGGRTRTTTFVKPVQAGGSVAGEVALCYWIATSTGGDAQYNWEDDAKALSRWDKRFERILKECRAVMAVAPPLERSLGLWKKGQVVFPHMSLTMQGVWQPDNLDSDAIRFQVNEELHSWEPGRLAKAYNRTTAHWAAAVFNVSNAGTTGGQLHQAFMAGTQEHWEVRCPGCGLWHEMRARWDPRHPELGGLRYDADGCRLDGGGYDYRKLAPTVRYQFPCGFQQPDDPVARRRMSLEGRYGLPRNPGASGERSFALEAVAVDYIPWLGLIREKHQALARLKLGDPEHWWRYLAERECRFYDPEQDRPVVGKLTVTAGVKKSRDGMPNRAFRFAALDRQAGSLAKGELPHWWLVIRDVADNGDSLLVFEGRVETDQDAVDAIARHGVYPTSVVVDSGDDTTHVYQFCLRHGYMAIKGSGESTFAHDDGTRKIFSMERPLYTLIAGAHPTKDDPIEEPCYWLYSKAGIRERLHWWRGATKWQVPEDVSDIYKSHLESEELQDKRNPRTGETVKVWVQVKLRNDLFVCECYIAMLAEMAGAIGILPEDVGDAKNDTALDSAASPG